jgi:hypothetical protein
MAKVTVSVRFIPTQDSPRSEVAVMFKAALDLAHLQLIVDGDIARCASCQATAAGADQLIHSSDCAADRVLKAWDALCSKVQRKPTVSTRVLSPTSAAA